MTGTINYHDKQVPFSFDEEHFRIEMDISGLVPKKDILGEFFSVDGNVVISGKEKLDTCFLTGKTDEGKDVYFNVMKYYSNLTLIDRLDGTIVYYYLLKRGFTAEDIHGMNFSGPEIDQITECTKTLTSKRPNGSMLELSITPTSSPVIKFESNGVCLEFSYSYGWVLSQENVRPLLLGSHITIASGNTLTFENLISIYEKTYSFISYLCFRGNITFSNISLIGDIKGESMVIGSFFISPDGLFSPDDNSKACIPFSLLATPNFSKLLSRFYSSNIYLWHIPHGVYDKNILTSGKYVTALAGFEYEFDYSKLKINHKSASANARKNIKKRLRNLSRNSNSKQKKILSLLIKVVDEDSISEELWSVVSHQEKFMTNIGNDLYLRFETPFVLKEICERIGKQRNAFAHGKIMAQFTKETVADYFFLDRIIYVLQLENCGYLDEIPNIIGSVL